MTLSSETEWEINGTNLRNDSSIIFCFLKQMPYSVDSVDRHLDIVDITCTSHHHVAIFAE